MNRGEKKWIANLGPGPAPARPRPGQGRPGPGLGLAWAGPKFDLKMSRFAYKRNGFLLPGPLDAVRTVQNSFWTYVSRGNSTFWTISEAVFAYTYAKNDHL